MKKVWGQRHPRSSSEPLLGLAISLEEAWSKQNELGLVHDGARAMHLEVGDIVNKSESGVRGIGCPGQNFVLDRLPLLEFGVVTNQDAKVLCTGADTTSCEVRQNETKLFRRKSRVVARQMSWSSAEERTPRPTSERTSGSMEAE